MALDRDGGVPLLGSVKPAPPVTIADGEGVTLSFPQVAVGAMSRDALGAIVAEVTHNVTKNVISNLCARLKDRCAFKLDNGTLCRVSRASHGNSHDFTESAPSKNGATA